MQRRLLRIFNGWSRPLPPPCDKAFSSYFPDDFEEDITLAEFLAITADWERTSTRKTELIERKLSREATAQELSELKRLKFLTEARGEYFAPLPLRQLATLQTELKSQGKWDTEQ